MNAVTYSLDGSTWSKTDRVPKVRCISSSLGVDPEQCHERKHYLLVSKLHRKGDVENSPILSDLLDKRQLLPNSG